jgi:hypothetical protein
MKPWWNPTENEHCGRHLPRLEERHGAGCECLKLMALVGGDRRSMRFGFCVRVLQKHWRLSCRHGEPDSAPADTRSGERWHDLGDIDAVKAILLRNA